MRSARVVGSQVHRHGPFHYRADAFRAPAAPSPGGHARRARSVSITSALVTSETGSCPMRGNANRVRLDIQSLPYFGLRQPGCIWVQTCSTAAAKVGVRWRRRFSASGSPPAAGELAVGEGERAGLLERDEREAAEPEFAAASADGDPLDPTPAAGRLDVEVQALAVAIPAGRGDGADEGGREGVFGLARGGVSRQHPFHQSFHRYEVERSGCYRSLWLVSSQDTLS